MSRRMRKRSHSHKLIANRSICSNKSHDITLPGGFDSAREGKIFKLDIAIKPPKCISFFKHHTYHIQLDTNKSNNALKCRRTAARAAFNYGPIQKRIKPTNPKDNADSDDKNDK